MEDNYLEKFSGKNIMITGGLGFIGSSLAHMLVNLKNPPERIIIVDSQIKGHGSNLFNLNGIEKKIETPNLENGGVDIRDSYRMSQLIPEVDYIFNLAGSVGHLSSKKDPLQDLQLNLEAHVSLLETIRKSINKNCSKPKIKIVFAGTRDQYGKVPEESLPVKEDTNATHASDPQGIHNSAAEFHHFWYRNFGIQATSLRITNTYGSRHQMKDSDQGFINWFIRQAIDGETIKLWGGGEVLRDCNYIDDVVDAFLVAASSEKSDGEAYNLGSCIKKIGRYEDPCGNQKTVAEMARKIVDITGSGKCEIIPYPAERKAIEPGHFCADTTKIYEQLGWEPKVSLEAGLRKTIEFYKINRKKYW